MRRLFKLLCSTHFPWLRPIIFGTVSEVFSLRNSELIVVRGLDAALLRAMSVAGIVGMACQMVTLRKRRLACVQAAAPRACIPYALRTLSDRTIPVHKSLLSSCGYVLLCDSGPHLALAHYS